MEVITIQELATQWGLTYEAVRQQVAKYKGELEGHVNKTGGRTFLDTYAVDFIQSKRQPLPVVVDNVELKAELAEAKTLANRSKEELLQAKEMIISLQQRINESQKLLIDKGEEQTKLVTDKIQAEAELKLLKGRYEDLQAQYSKLQAQFDSIQKDLQETKDQVSAAGAINLELNRRLTELNESYSKTIFGLYKKKKGK